MHVHFFNIVDIFQRYCLCQVTLNIKQAMELGRQRSIGLSSSFPQITS